MRAGTLRPECGAVQEVSAVRHGWRRWAGGVERARSRGSSHPFSGRWWMGSHWTGGSREFDLHREGVMRRVDLALVCTYGKGCGVSRRRGRASALSHQRGQPGLEGDSEALAGTGEGIPGRTGQEVPSFTLEEQFAHTTIPSRRREDGPRAWWLCTSSLISYLRPARVLQGIHG